MRSVLVAVAVVAVFAVAGSSTAASSAGGGCSKGTYRSLVLVSARTGAIDRAFPNPNGGVNVVLADGHGGWFVAGVFNCIGRVKTNDLAHLHADGTLDAAFKPQLPAGRQLDNPDDSPLALGRLGTTLYVAGSFGVVALDATTGALRWRTPVSGAGSATRVLALAASKQRVFAGGDFSNVGGKAHPSLVALSPRTSKLLPWRTPSLAAKPLMGPIVSIGALALDQGRLFIGSDGLKSVAGKPRDSIAILDAQSGRLTSWTAPQAHGRSLIGDVATILVTHGRVFTAGHDGFGITNEQTGALDPLNHETGGYRFAVSGDIVYLAGNCRNSFSVIERQPRNNLAALDFAAGGRVTRWAPNIAKYTCVDDLAAGPDQVIVAGSFTATLN